MSNPKNHFVFTQVDLLATGFSDAALNSLARDIDRGYRRFFEKRGINAADLPCNFGVNSRRKRQEETE